MLKSPRVRGDKISLIANEEKSGRRKKKSKHSNADKNSDVVFPNNSSNPRLKISASTFFEAREIRINTRNSLPGENPPDEPSLQEDTQSRGILSKSRANSALCDNATNERLSRKYAVARTSPHFLNRASYAVNAVTNDFNIDCLNVTPGRVDAVRSDIEEGQRVNTSINGIEKSNSKKRELLTRDRSASGYGSSNATAGEILRANFGDTEEFEGVGSRDSRNNCGGSFDKHGKTVPEERLMEKDILLENANKLHINCDRQELSASNIEDKIISKKEKRVKGKVKSRAKQTGKIIWTGLKFSWRLLIDGLVSLSGPLTYFDLSGGVTKVWSQTRANS